MPQVVDDELRRRSRPLQLIGQESAEQDLFGAIRVGVRHREPFFTGKDDVAWEAFERDGFQRPFGLAAPKLDRAGKMHAEVDQAVLEKRNPHLD